MSPHLQVVKAPDTKIVHTCSCGKTYTLTTWSDLLLVGFIADEEPGEYVAGVAQEILENRNCTCGSTRAISISFNRLVALFNSQCKSVRRATSALVDALRVTGEVPDRDPERTGAVELIKIERENCAQTADKAAADLRLLARSRPGIAIAKELHQRAELADEIAASIRRRS